MKSLKRIFGIVFLCGLLFLPTHALSEVVERFVAVVNNEVIFLSELEEFGRRVFEEVEKNSLPSEREEKTRQARQEVLNQLIENKLLDQEIKKRKVEVGERDVEATIEDILKQNRFTLNDLKMVLAKQGMTLTTYRQRVRDELGKMRLVTREIKSKIVIKEEDLRKAYNDRIPEFMIPLEVQVQQIFFIFPGGASPDRVATIEKEAQSVLEKAKKGENFAELAKNYSQGPEAKEGGVLGFFKPKELMPELDEAVFQMKAGEISPLIRSSEGFHILRVMERKGGEPKPFGEVQGQIRDEMTQAETEKRLKEWMKALKEKAYIEIKL
jgi:peptidyl-prolyl cis-trans isomerase SurA